MPSSAADPVARVLATVRRTIDEEGLARHRGHCSVAVSGGADSTCLLDVMVTLFGRDELVAVHVDHGFRADSARDAEHVEALADRLGVRCDVIRVDGPIFARQHRVGLEEAGRSLRYRALRGHRLPLYAVTGHTRDDSVETSLLHLLRGCGLDGLGGIAPRQTLVRDAYEVAEGATLESGYSERHSQLYVERPLLRVSRPETAAYCRARGLEYLLDPTNDDPRHLRNRVRHHLLPVLRTYNPAIDDALERTALLTRQELEWVDELAARRWRSLAYVGLWGPVQVHTASLNRQPRAAQRRIIRHAVKDLARVERRTSLDAPPITLTFDAVERAIAVAQPDGPPRAQLGGGLVAVRNGDRLEIRREGGAST